MPVLFASFQYPTIMYRSYFSKTVVEVKNLKHHTRKNIIYDSVWFHFLDPIVKTTSPPSCFFLKKDRTIEMSLLLVLVCSN